MKYLVIIILFVTIYGSDKIVLEFDSKVFFDISLPYKHSIRKKILKRSNKVERIYYSMKFRESNINSVINIMYEEDSLERLIRIYDNIFEGYNCIRDTIISNNILIYSIFDDKYQNIERVYVFKEYKDSFCLSFEIYNPNGILNPNEYEIYKNAILNSNAIISKVKQ